MLNREWTRAILAVCMVLSAAPLYAQNEGITVSGTGEVLARPNRLEIHFQASASSELTADAIVKYNDSLRRTTSAFKQLEMENLTIEENGLTIGRGGQEMMAARMMRMRMMAVGGDEEGGMKPETMIARSLTVVLTSVDKLQDEQLLETVGKLLDTASDADAPGGSVVFALTGVEALREQAYQKAFENAKAAASRLAKLSDTRLGRVLSITEFGSSADYTDVSSYYDEDSYPYAATSSSSSSAQGGLLRSQQLVEMPVRVSLHVRFAIEERNSDQ